MVSQVLLQYYDIGAAARVHSSRCTDHTWWLWPLWYSVPAVPVHSRARNDIFVLVHFIIIVFVVSGLLVFRTAVCPRKDTVRLPSVFLVTVPVGHQGSSMGCG